MKNNTNILKQLKGNIRTFYFLLIFSFTCQASVPSLYKYSNFSGLEDLSIRSITRLNNGKLLFGTLAGVYEFNGYKFSKLKSNPIIAIANIFALLESSDKSLWIGTKNKGLFRKKDNQWLEVTLLKSDKNIRINSIIEFKTNILWVATNKGLFKIDVNEETIITQHVLTDLSISTLIQYESSLIMGIRGSIIKYKPLTNVSQTVSIFDDLYIHSLHVGHNNKLWVGTSKNLLVFNSDSLKFIKPILPEVDDRFVSIQEYNEEIWIATLSNGLYKFSNGHLENIISPIVSQESDNLGLQDIFVDQGQVWLGTFQDGVIKLNLQSLKFKYENNSVNSIYCSDSSKFRSIVSQSKSILWIGSDTGLIKYDLNNKKCQTFPLKKIPDKINANSIVDLIIKDNKLFIAYTYGINQFDLETQEFTDFNIDIEYSNFIAFNKNDELFIGTGDALYLYTATNELINISKRSFKNTIFFNSVETPTAFIFSTSTGLLKLSKDFQLSYFLNNNEELQKSESSTLYMDENFIYTYINGVGVVQISEKGHIKKILNEKVGLPNKFQIYSIVVKNNIAWLGSNNGLLKYNLLTQAFNRYLAIDGIGSNQFFSFGSLLDNGEVFLSGFKGFVHFDPEEIIINESIGNIILTKLSLLNKTVEPNQTTVTGFSINKDINELDQVELGYKDYIIGFEFAALDYADPMRNQYAYRLLGFKDDWVFTDATNRRATFTNLSSGDYTLQVKASNKDGIWSKTPKELKIKVYPAPWLSPWAFFAYFVITVFSIWAFIRYKTIASRKRAEQLEVTVEQRTQEVNRQKKMVESLLDHKNEVFANVTHEFKTPLALILGPTDQLADKPELAQHSDELNMIQRNAKRLILMVGQILKLSQAELDKEVIRESQALHPTLTMLFESFKPLALDKNIELTLENHQEVNVYATADCLEIVIGNLISNALKYTNTGGSISIKSTLNDNYVSIHVTDTGSGIDSHDLNKIFKRFTRLDSHKSIQGTGIGLSVVKEITEANDGQVRVNSELGKGSEFIVTFPVSEMDANLDLSQELVDQLVSNTDNELSQENSIAVRDSMIDKNKINVLIIEDNLDMQAHIGNVLKRRFNCLFADRGKKGISLALQEVPDIVICDVMMPGMDGYQVTRILRHDSRTSHIPIVLLTALNTKESRIKGWRENIDVYVTKPFDATELNVQIDNILTIRKLLQKKTNTAFKSNDSLSSLELPEQDLKFIEKLKDVIGQYYSNEYFQKADIASKMAVSERQLQRKVKALINENPMDMLRDYRLQQASMKLKTGMQVSLVSDECGFNAVPYFSTCFKNKYGLSPKQYQTLDKDK